MNIGIYLGTFNPPHIGHLNCLYRALESQIVDKILVVPAFKNPWKVTPEDKFDPNNHDGMSLDAEFELRKDLCKAMFKDLIDDGKARVSEIEYSIWRQYHKYADDCIYSYETLEELQRRPAHWLGDLVGEKDKDQKIKFVIVSTTETVATMPRWRNGKWILASFPILAMTSEHLDLINLKANARLDPESRKALDNSPTIVVPDIPIHSTDLRERFLNYQSLMPFVNKETNKMLQAERTKVKKLYERIKSNSVKKDQ